MGKHKHSKVKGFLNISYEGEIHANLETWDERISIVRNFQNYGFLNISPETEIYTVSNHGMSEFLYYGKIMGKLKQYPGSALHV